MPLPYAKNLLKIFKNNKKEKISLLTLNNFFRTSNYNSEIPFIFSTIKKRVKKRVKKRARTHIGDSIEIHYMTL